MKEKTCCFTGHRTIPAQERQRLAQALEVALKKLIQQGVIYYGAGGALGFDTLASQVVLKLRQEYPQIKLILVLPCKNQTKGWQQQDVEVYQEILTKADKVVFLAEAYTNGCMQRRNRHLVDQSGTCICYLTQKTGGTAYTVSYAKAKGIPIIWL